MKNIKRKTKTFYKFVKYSTLVSYKIGPLFDDEGSLIPNPKKIIKALSKPFYRVFISPLETIKVSRPKFCDASKSQDKKATIDCIVITEMGVLSVIGR